MTELGVIILAAADDERAILKMVVESTSVAKALHVAGDFPAGASDLTFRRIQEANPDVVLVDVPLSTAEAALRSIELLHLELPKCAVFAIGSMSQPQVIVSAMRAGAREFIERPVNTNSLLEAFIRVSTLKHKVHGNGQRGKLITVLNAKGGNGATTVAVNTALALSAQGPTALVDLAPLGHAALHLNCKPSFGLVDAVRNLHRLDYSLLESFMVRYSENLHLLAGLNDPMALESSSSELTRLFDLLVSKYSAVVVDTSSRLDGVTRVLAELSESVLLVAQADVASLWSAGRVQQFLGTTGRRDRVRVVLNRFRKIPGFSEADVESVTKAKLLWKLPDHHGVTEAIDRGVPVTEQNHSEIARSFAGLAAALVEPPVRETTSWLRSWTLTRTA